ncbi:glycosyl transferase family 2 [Paenibacillus taihuensis]|uniref:Glycosyl transferase family 2 n=1 Tax=Paenibacillus taihuensis TaxID=1156355 RepID=A0A3D9S3K3_9BACL|nr:glycosyltransferase family 2 protein [Paenibacillus taihuensis]REE84494.1 glycosyl transferase family 2 [Paenibacillus taihuensis]
MKKISILIPVYNVEPYIRKCLESVVNQTYTNLEIICIDDGSTDASGAICDEYASKDSRFTVVHQKNRGNPSALNAGLDLICGDYVGFIDPDDWVELDFYRAACEAMEVEGADIVCTGLFKDTDVDCMPFRNKKPIPQGLLSREHILNYTFIRDVYPGFGAYLCNKLFKAKFFTSTKDSGYHLRLDEEMVVGGDVLLFTECALKAGNAVYLEQPYYHYYQRANSAFHSKNVVKRMGSLKAYAAVLERFDKNNINPNTGIWVKRFYTYHASLISEIAIENNDAANLALLQEEMKRYLTEYLDTNQDHPDRIARIESLLKFRL